MNKHTFKIFILISNMVILFALTFLVKKWGMFIPWPGTELTPPPVELWNLNHWATREVPMINTGKYNLH